MLLIVDEEKVEKVRKRDLTVYRWKKIGRNERK
jgi:hypothetical protein